MEESEKSPGQEQTSDTVLIGNRPIMQAAIDIVSLLGKHPSVILCAKGNSIPNAVAVANIVTEKMLYGNSKVQEITLDTDKEPGIGMMLSTIRITLYRT